MKRMQQKCRKKARSHARNSPFPLRHVDFHLIHECLGPPHSPHKRQLDRCVTKVTVHLPPTATCPLCEWTLPHHALLPRDEDEDFNCCVIKTGFYELSLNYLVDACFCCINVVDLCRLLVLWCILCRYGEVLRYFSGIPPCWVPGNCLPFGLTFRFFFLYVWFWVSLGINGKSWILFSSSFDRVPQYPSLNRLSQHLFQLIFIYLCAYVTLGR